MPFGAIPSTRVSCDFMASLVFSIAANRLFVRSSNAVVAAGVGIAGDAPCDPVDVPELDFEGVDVEFIGAGCLGPVFFSNCEAVASEEGRGGLGPASQLEKFVQCQFWS